MYQSVKVELTWSHIFELIGYMLKGITHTRYIKIDWENPNTYSHTDILGVEQYY